MGEMQTVVFSLNNELCGANTSQVEEIIKYQDVAKVPGSVEFVEGVANLRGKIVPVINLNKKFELGETTITKKTKIIITRVNESNVGFIVNDVSEIVKFSDDDIEVVPDMIKKVGNAYLMGVGKKGDMLISILDLPRILTDSEVKKINDVIKR